MSESNNYFDHNADIGIIGRGNTLEECFCDTAHRMFSLMDDLPNIHLTNIINFEFEEENVELALVTWLNLLLTKAQEHHLIFSDFRLKREGNMWKATASGEPRNDKLERGIEVKGATLSMLEVKKIEHIWESRCVVSV